MFGNSFHVIVECIYALFEHHFEFFLLLKNDTEILVFPVKEHLFTP